LITALLLALVVGFAIGQPPAAPNEIPKLDRLHEQRIEVYAELLTVAQVRGSNGHEQLRKLLLVKFDAAKTPPDQMVLAMELLELCRQYEQELQTIVPENVETLLNATAERIEAEILVEQILANK
jgi:hypothetical protein